VKYANIRHSGRTMNTLGDQMQIIAVDYLYETIGVNRDEIVYIEKDSLGEYSGEKVVLPVAFPLFDYYEGGLRNMFSKGIKPVFLGHTIFKSYLLPDEVAFYKTHEPIGCRDERALNTFRSYGIEAYLMGCMTACLPKRKASNAANKVFIVDVSPTALKHIPIELRERAEILSHFTDATKGIKEIAERRYEWYKNEGELVITSLLHCSVPCIAAGIPTIIMKDLFSYRFAWLEKICKVHLKDEYSMVDWQAKTIEYENHKSLLIDIARDRILGKEPTEQMLRVHDFYMSREKQEYVVDALVSIEEHIKRCWTDKKYPYEYSLWGMTQIAEEANNYIQRLYPNAILKNVYDKYRDTSFCGLATKRPEEISNNPNETVIVTAQAAKQEALELFSSIKKNEEMYVFAEVQK